MNDNTKVEMLKPLTRLLITIGELPTSYLMSMTYFEQIIWFTNYLQNTVISAINNNAKAVEEIQEFLKTLDLQDEVDKKIDEMVESGELAEIITQYLQINGVLAFNTLADLVSATNIIDGSVCKTLGTTTYNDGYGALYKIRTIINTDVVDGVNIVALDISDTLIAEKIQNADINNLKTTYQPYIVFIGDSWTTEYPSGTTMWYTKVAQRLNLIPKVYGDGGSGFIHQGAHGTFDNQITTALADIDDVNKVKIVAVTGGINDYHDSNVTADALRLATENTLNSIKTNFPKSEIVFTPLNYSYEQMTERAFSFYSVLKNAGTHAQATILTNCYNWIKTYPESYVYYDTHMNQRGNDIFATAWLSAYHGEGYNHIHTYTDYPMSGLTTLNAQAKVVGSKVSIYAQLEIASNTTFSAGNVNVINFYNENVGMPLYNLSARPVLCWVNFQTNAGNEWKVLPAYLNVDAYTGTSDNQGGLKIIVHFNESETITATSYMYISCDIDTALTI